MPDAITEIAGEKRRRKLLLVKGRPISFASARFRAFGERKDGVAQACRVPSLSVGCQITGAKRRRLISDCRVGIGGLL